jgi:hypothetical protein
MIQFKLSISTMEAQSASTVFEEVAYDEVGIPVNKFNDSAMSPPFRFS